MWKYDPKDASSAIPEGDYDAVLAATAIGVSKSSGAPMLTVTFSVYGPSGEKQVSDYIVKATTFKYKKIAKALGKEAEFKAGSFEIEKYVGESLVLTIGIKPSDGKHDESNTIKDYKPKRAVAVGDKGDDAPPADDSEIPF